MPVDDHVAWAERETRGAKQSESESESAKRRAAARHRSADDEPETSKPEQSETEQATAEPKLQATMTPEKRAKIVDERRQHQLRVERQNLARLQQREHELAAHRRVGDVRKLTQQQTELLQRATDPQGNAHARHQFAQTRNATSRAPRQAPRQPLQSTQPQPQHNSTRQKQPGPARAPKGTLCKLMKSGYCKWSDNCHDAHSTTELQRTLLPNLDNPDKPIWVGGPPTCKEWYAGRCRKPTTGKHACSFAHMVYELEHHTYAHPSENEQRYQQQTQNNNKNNATSNSSKQYQQQQQQQQPQAPTTRNDQEDGPRQRDGSLRPTQDRLQQQLWSNQQQKQEPQIRAKSREPQGRDRRININIEKGATVDMQEAIAIREQVQRFRTRTQLPGDIFDPDPNFNHTITPEEAKLRPFWPATAAEQQAAQREQEEWTTARRTIRPTTITITNL
jgi:hypothetical protein